MRLPAIALTILGAVAGAAVAPAAAYADETATCEVVEIEASSTDKPSIDPALKDFQKKLKQGPFKRFNTFKLSARKAESLAELKPTTFKTPRGAVQLTLRGVEKRAKKRARVSLAITLLDESGKQYIETRSQVDAGDYLPFARDVSDTASVVTFVGCK